MNYDGPDERFLRRARRLFRPLARWHRHRVKGLDDLPDGPFLLVINHSFATYDALLLAYEVYNHTGRVPAGLGDDLIFRTPWIRGVGHRAGIVPANHDNAHELIARGRIVALAPGGMREALRPTTEAQTVRWDKRRGFVKLSLRTQTPMVLAACPAADDIYTVYENVLTKVVYKNLRMPFPILRGIGPTLIPRPVALTHHLSTPIVPPPLDEADFDAQVDVLHDEVKAVMGDLLRR